MRYIASIKIFLGLFISGFVLANPLYLPVYIDLYEYFYNEDSESLNEGDGYIIAREFKQGNSKNFLFIESIGEKGGQLIVVSKLDPESITNLVVDGNSSKSLIQAVSGASMVEQENDGFILMKSKGFDVAKNNEGLSFVNCVEDSRILCGAYIVDYINDPVGQAFVSFSGKHTIKSTVKNEKEDGNPIDAYFYYNFNLKSVAEVLEKIDDKKHAEYIEAIISVLNNLQLKMDNLQGEKQLFDLGGFITLSNNKFVVIDPVQEAETKERVEKRATLTVIDEINKLKNTLGSAKSMIQNNKHIEYLLNASKAHRYVNFLIKYAALNNDDERAKPILGYNFSYLVLLNGEIAKLIADGQLSFDVNKIYKGEGDEREKFLNYISNNNLLN